MIRWIHGLDQDALPQTGCVVSIGSFDGVHAGHEAVTRTMSKAGKESGCALLVASFEPHPKTVLANVPEQRLTSLDERARLLSGLGVDAFVTLQFDRKMASMTPEVFVEEVLVKRLKASVVVVGHDHRFGKNRLGDVTLLKALGAELGFEVLEVEAFEKGAAPISSSRIRQLVENGLVEEACAMLGRYYDMRGVVIRGAGRGRQIGVPTANLDPVDPLRLVPAIGVYAVKTWIPGENRWLPGMMNIGRRPTFEGEGRHLEVNIIDWSGDLYGDEVRVEFVQRIRDEVKFDGIDALLRQLKLDKDRCSALMQGVT